MSEIKKQLSNPISTGGLGPHFENRVQTSFVVLMLTGGVCPCLSSWPITKIKLQGKYQGFEVDDLIVYSEQLGTNKQSKLLGQIKHSISITKGNKELKEIIQAAWKDFNNKDLFSEETDVISLICGPLSATDTIDVRNLLNHARAADSAEDFINRTSLAKFTSNKLREKLNVFKEQLKLANNNVELTNDELWRFLKTFYLLIYDLDIEGVTLSLLYTLIEQHSKNNAQTLWNQIKDHVERKNEYAGLIEVESIPEQIRSQFKKSHLETIPENLVGISLNPTAKDWSKHDFANELTLACLIGSWDESSQKDKDVLSLFAKEDYKDFICKLRELLQEPDPPLSFKNGVWNIKKRKSLFKSLGSRIFDEHLDKFQEVVTSVLKEPDPQFELKKEERFSASIYGKVLKHSYSLRNSLAEGLALISCYSSFLINTSSNKSENTVILSIKEIFKNADWIHWASLNPLLPNIAESEPNEFLNALGSALSKTSNPFITIFSQEGNGIVGSNYITGLLWALENLAWEEQYIVRVTILLGELASIDPGGQWSNRPSNSLTEIFLPWHSQTLASIEKRKIAIETLNKEFTDVAWKLLLTLLPNKVKIASGSHKPKWRNSFPEDWDGKVSQEDHWEQISFYSDFAVEQSKNNLERLKTIISDLDHLTKPALDNLLIYLDSNEITTKSEEEKLELWNQLISFASKHERYSYADWAMNSDLIDRLKKVAKKLESKNPINLYSRLFNERDFDLFTKNGNWQEQAKQLEESRKKSLKIILDYGDIDAIFKLVKIVEYPSAVGRSLANIADNSYDKDILPDLLITNNKKFEEFTKSYIYSKQNQKGWEWVDNIDTKEWSTEQINKFFISLPFKTGSWERVSKILSESEESYWKEVYVNPYEAEDNLDFVVSKLIQYKKPFAAIDCIFKSIYDKKPVENKKIIQALTLVLNSSEVNKQIDTNHITKIINFLQEDNKTDENDLLNIEMAYLSLLDGHHGARPKILEHKLSNDPKFFHEAISLSFFSENSSPEERQKISKTNNEIAGRVGQLLYEWKLPPGSKKDGSFCEEKFNEWLKQTNEYCTQSGHLAVALQIIGQALYYSPPDSDGFWINRSVAQALNANDSEEMRRGFAMEIFNSRGAHWVDPAGKPEKELAAKYWELAEDTENAGYYRLADALKRLSKSYNNDAERIINEYKAKNTH